jgi:hypothetical protein
MDLFIANWTVKGSWNQILAAAKELQDICCELWEHLQSDTSFGFLDSDRWRLECRYVRWHHGLRRSILFRDDRLHLLHHPLHLWQLYPSGPPGLCCHCLVFLSLNFPVVGGGSRGGCVLAVGWDKWLSLASSLSAFPSCCWLEGVVGRAVQYLQSSSWALRNAWWLSEPSQGQTVHVLVPGVIQLGTTSPVQIQGVSLKEHGGSLCFHGRGVKSLSMSSEDPSWPTENCLWWIDLWFPKPHLLYWPVFGD